MILFAGSANAGDAVWFDDLPKLFRPSDQQRVALVQYARAALTGAETDFPVSLRADDLPRIVILAVSDGVKQASVFVGRGRGLRVAVDNAVAQAGDLPAHWVRLDIVDRADSYSISSTHLPGWQRAVHGLAFDRQVDVALLADQLIAGKYLDEVPKVAIGRMAQAHPKLNALKDAKRIRVHRFTTLGAFCDDARALVLTHGRESFENATAGDFEQAARLAGDYLRRAVDNSGRFDYWYKPTTDRGSKKYNILRHCGSIFAMLQVYEISREPAMLDAAVSALNYVAKQVRTVNLNGKQIDVIVEDNEFKLGAGALAVLALSKYVSVTGDKSKLPLAQRLAELMPALQTDSGRFAMHKASWPDAIDSQFISGYYPGEAIFALVRLYALDGDARWLQCARRNARYLYNVRDADLPIERRLPDHWLLYGLNELHRAQPHDDYVAQAGLIASAIRLPQHTTPPWPHWVGGYFAPPRSTPTSTRTEGLTAAWFLLRDFGDDAKQLAAVRLSAEMGARFILRCQLQAPQAMFYPDPRRCLGGVGARLDRPDIRIDFPQHAISAWIAMAKILRQPDAIKSDSPR